MDKLYEKAETGCCPRFDPQPWEEKEHVWKDKLFVKDRVRSFFHIPLNFGRVMTRNMTMIQEAGAVADTPILLCDENSLWGSDIYIAVSKAVPKAHMELISGTFVTKVFEGPYRNIPQWIKEIKRFIQTKGRQILKLYMFYTTCPKCAKFYGKNYIVLVAQV
jgi:hypothetical protein